MTAENPTGDQEPGAGPTSGTHGSGEHGSAQHGSLSEEALKLAETLQTWLSTGAATTGVGTSSECKVCPLCQLIGVVNGMRPEVLGHLSEAGFALMAAFKAATESSERAWTGTNRPPVQHIKVT
ncbi:MAG TPA: DUF5304 family protein [Frankiaceae bacterium]|nr:DUF5304 family protein [Frankiaceae bacterium]